LAYQLHDPDGAAEANMDETFDVERFVAASAAAIGLSIAPAHQPGVVANLERIAAMARLVMEFPLPEEIEPAPVFEP